MCTFENKYNWLYSLSIYCVTIKLSTANAKIHLNYTVITVKPPIQDAQSGDQAKVQKSKWNLLKKIHQFIFIIVYLINL